MKRCALNMTIAGMLFALASQALALPVDVRYAGSSPSKDIRVIHPFGSGTYRLGTMKLEVDMNDGNGPQMMQGFCVDLRQSTSSQFKTYELAALEDAPLDGGSPYSPMGAGKALAISELWGEHFAEIGSSRNKAAAFQMAVWEIVFENRDDGVETPNAWDVSCGRLSTANSTVAGIANNWLGTIGDASQTLPYSLFALSNESGARTYQDFVIYMETGDTPPAVPEPLTMGSAIVGLCGLGTYVRKRTTA